MKMVYSKYSTGSSLSKLKFGAKKQSSLFSLISNSILLGIITMYAIALPLALCFQMGTLIPKTLETPDSLVQRETPRKTNPVARVSQGAGSQNSGAAIAPTNADSGVAKPVTPTPPSQPAVVDRDTVPGVVLPAKQVTRPQPPVTQPYSDGMLSPYQFQMLARIISAEAKGEPFTGQVAVGAVILNRVESGRFPKTIAANVLKPGQFEPVANGHIWNEPTDSAVKAARLALQGWDPTNGALYFFNPAKTSSRWIWSRPVITRIGNHIFAV